MHKYNVVISKSIPFGFYMYIYNIVQHIQMLYNCNVFVLLYILFTVVNIPIFKCVKLISVNTKYPMVQGKQNSRFSHYSKRETCSAKIREK